MKTFHIIIPKISENQEPDIPDVDIQIEGITKLLQELDCHKATGPDNISSNLLKQSALEYILHLSIFTHLERHKVLCEQ